MWSPRPNKNWTSKKKFWSLQKKKYIYLYNNNPFLSISVRFGISATIRIGRVIQCLPYAGFCLGLSLSTSLLKEHLYISLVNGNSL